ncbi:hypothetical protein EC991_004727 [Linnemannia zychae]|nr:hypothetical protein EC991_004727 [Linnemannia zychae]
MNPHIDQFGEPVDVDTDHLQLPTTNATLVSETEFNRIFPGSSNAIPEEGPNPRTSASSKGSSPEPSQSSQVSSTSKGSLPWPSQTSQVSSASKRSLPQPFQTSQHFSVSKRSIPKPSQASHPRLASNRTLPKHTVPLTKLEKRSRFILDGFKEQKLTYRVAFIDALKTEKLKMTAAISKGIEYLKSQCRTPAREFLSDWRLLDGESSDPRATIWFYFVKGEVCGEKNAFACAFFPMDYGEDRLRTTVYVAWDKFKGRSSKAISMIIAHEIGHVLGLAHGNIDKSDKGESLQLWKVSGFDDESIMLSYFDITKKITKTDCRAITFYNVGFDQKSLVCGFVDGAPAVCKKYPRNFVTPQNGSYGYVKTGYGLTQCLGVRNPDDPDYAYVMQSDGNFVACNTNTQKAVWATGSQGFGIGGDYSVVFQRDGNLVIYDKFGIATWASRKVPDMDNSADNNRPSGDEMTLESRKTLITLKDAVRIALSPNRGDDLDAEQGSQDKDNASITSRASEEEIVRLAVQGIPASLSCSRPGLLNNIATEKDLPCLPPSEEPYQPTFQSNVPKPAFRVPLPEPGFRFTSTPQLSFAHQLLSRYQSSAALTSGSSANSTVEELSEQEKAWLVALEKDSEKQECIRGLTSQLVTEFLASPRKDEVAIAEIVLLGPVLERKDHRRVLSYLAGQLEREPLLDLELLQGLIQLLQEASPGYLIDDDLIRILQVLRKRLKDTYQALGDSDRPSSAHIYYLTTAISRVLDAMIQGNIKGVRRIEDHKPLVDILVQLKDSSDPYLKFQATYAWQALQFVGDDESPLHAVLRFGGGITMVLLAGASIFKFDVDNLCNGLREVGLATGQAYDVVKAGVESVQAFQAGGHGTIDSVLMGFRSGTKRLWYPALQGARLLVWEGRLADFERVIFEAPCRREYFFQRGICQLLGEIAMDPVWATYIRRRAVDFLVRLFRGDGHWISGVKEKDLKETILSILHHLAEEAEQTVQNHATVAMQDLVAVDGPLRSCPLALRLSPPKVFPLLEKALEATALEDKLQEFMLAQRECFQQNVYIPPHCKVLPQETKDASEDEFREESEDVSNDGVESRALPLMGEVMKFLESDRQVFLVLGDSGAGKSTFNRHLQHELMVSYKKGHSIPIYINLPDTENPESELIQRHLKTLDFTEEDIQKMKKDRRFIIICDGYDESQLSVNLHTTNLFNRAGHWKVQMIISCRNTYLGKGYRERFKPQPNGHYITATTHLFQEVVIVPFSSAQIGSYVEQFVQDSEVRELFGKRPVWSAREYIDKLAQVPKLMSLVKNPFLLVLALRALPDIVDGVPDISQVEVTRVKIYETSVVQWLDFNRRRLQRSRLSDKEKKTLDQLIEGDFAELAIKFLKDLATAIFKEQDGNPIVRYVHVKDEKTWKVNFFGNEPKVVILRMASPLTRAGVLHRFIHRSFLEYFYDFIEQNIHQLRSMRVREYEQFVKGSYIPCFAKHSFQQQDEEPLPLLQRVEKFLETDQQVFLLLGDPGSGKTTFNRHLEYQLWAVYVRGGRIPLFINLATIHHPEQDMIAKHLLTHGFKEDQIEDMRLYREFYVICTGYDASRFQDNLYSANQFNCARQWRVKMIISCTSTVLTQDYRGRFEPPSPGHHIVAADLFQEAIIVPLSTLQIKEYVAKFILDEGTPKLFDGLEVWGVDEYMDKLESMTRTMELAMTPFLLKLLLTTLPSLSREVPDPTRTVIMYERFVSQWVEQNKRRVETTLSKFSPEAQREFESLVDNGFEEAALDFSKRLAASIIRRNDGSPVVEYETEADRGTWKERFFGIDARTEILRELSPLARTRNQYQFIHRSLLDYFSSIAIEDNLSDEAEGSETHSDDEDQITIPARIASPVGFPSPVRSSCSARSSSPVIPIPSALDTTQYPQVMTATMASTTTTTAAVATLSSHVRKLALTSDQENIDGLTISDQATIALLAERVKQDVTLKQKLLTAIEQSKSDPGASQNAANAITILVRAGVRFNGVDLSGVRIPGADLSGGDFDSVQLAGADLTGVNLTRAWLRQVDFTGARMESVSFGEQPYLRLVKEVNACAYSPDGKLLAIGFEGGAISLRRTDSWVRVQDLVGHDWTVTSLAFSPDGLQLASASDDHLIRLWDVSSGRLQGELKEQIETISSIVYSPDGRQLAMACQDSFVCLYDLQTLSVSLVLKGHTAAVTCVAFSPRGDLIASASHDGTVRTWQPESGLQQHHMDGHTGWILSVSISPNNNMIASCGQDKTVRLWDGMTGVPLFILRGHTAFVKRVSFSPSGHQIASGGDDCTVRLWDGLVGTPGPVLSGHTESVSTLVYAPSGQQMATGSWDKRVRLWDTNTTAHLDDQNPFTGYAEALSPSLRELNHRAVDDHSTVSSLGSASASWISPNSSDHTFSFASVACSPDSQLVATCIADTVLLYNAEIGTFQLGLRGHENSVSCLAFSSDGKFLASGGYDNTARIWDVKEQRSVHTLQGHTQPVTTVAFSPNGYCVATGSNDSSVCTWSIRTGSRLRIFSGHSEEVGSLFYSPGPNLHLLASGGRDMTIKLWDTRHDHSYRVLKGHTNVVESVSFSNNGEHLLSGSGDRTARIWNVSSGETVRELIGHKKTIKAVAFSPNNRRIATGSWDNTVRIWDVATGKCLVEVTEFFGEVNSISWKPLLPDTSDVAMYFATGCTDKSVRMWKLVEHKDGTHRVQLHWRSASDGLVLSSAITDRVTGLSRNNLRLLQQRGAVGEPSDTSVRLW